MTPTYVGKSLDTKTIYINAQNRNPMNKSMYSNFHNQGVLSKKKDKRVVFSDLQKYMVLSQQYDRTQVTNGSSSTFSGKYISGGQQVTCENPNEANIEEFDIN